MIEISEQASSILTRSHRRFFRVSSWRAGRLLTQEIPAATGALDVDRSLRIPERLTLVVPRTEGGQSWAPSASDHPLATYGQQLCVEIGIGGIGQDVEWFTLGWFVIIKSVVNGDSVDVEAQGLLSLVDEARLVSPYQPSGTIISTIRGLVEPGLTIDTTTAPADRAVPSNINYDDDRLGAVLEILDAWGADGAVDETGTYVIVMASDPTNAVLALSTGSGGTVVEASGSSDRTSAVNAVVARGTASDGTQVQGVAYDTLSSSPTRYGGPFSPYPVPHYFSSPLLTTQAQCLTAAQTILARGRRYGGERYTVEMVPYPPLRAGDGITIDGALMVVERFSLPLHSDGGSQILTVRRV